MHWIFIYNNYGLTFGKRLLPSHFPIQINVDTIIVKALLSEYHSSLHQHLVFSFVSFNQKLTDTTYITKTICVRRSANIYQD